MPTYQNFEIKNNFSDVSVVGSRSSQNINSNVRSFRLSLENPITNENNNHAIFLQSDEDNSNVDEWIVAEEG